MQLSTKLVNALNKAATSTRKTRNLLTPIGGAVFLIFLGTIVFLSAQVDGILGYRQLLPNPFNTIVSLPFICTGTFLILWSILHFIKARGTPVPFNPPRKLVNTGPYAYSRNPMLTGVFSLLFGVAILLQSVSLAFLFTPFFVMINLLELKTIEEPELEKRLGKEYLKYKERTPMFIPRLKSMFKGKTF